MRAVPKDLREALGFDARCGPKQEPEFRSSALPRPTAEAGLAIVSPNPYLQTVSSDQVDSVEAPFTIERLSWRQWLVELLTAFAITAGLAILWLCENVRNTYFRFLDWMDFRPHIKPASAFPPGRPRKLKAR